MRLVAGLRSLWWNLARRARVDAALDEEVREYVELLTAEYARRGMSPPAARRAARLEVGGVEQVKEATRDAWLGDAAARGARALRYACRTLARSPAFVTIAVATLAIGIGGATAVFTVITGSVLRALPAVTEPSRLVSLERAQPRVVLDEFGWPEYLDLRAEVRAFSGVAAFNGTSLAMRVNGDTARAWVGYGSGNFFSVLGVRPAAGRLLGQADEGSSGEHPVAVISYDLWQTRFAGSPSAIGSTLMLEEVPFTVVGVAPPEFVGAMTLHRMQLWIPATMIPQVTHGMLAERFLTQRGIGWLRLVGRLARGRTIEQANRELVTISARLAAAYPTDRDKTVRIAGGPGMTTDERDEIARVPRLLAVAVALLLLIAAANVASLSLVRASARGRELATRLALGASRVSLVRQLVLEAAVLSTLGGVLGVVLARVLVRSASIVNTIPDVSTADLHLTWPVFVVALAVSAGTAMLVAALPAWRIGRLAAAAVLKDGAGGAVRRRSKGQRALVTAQVAASLVLLAAAAMIFTAFNRALRTDLGFDVRGLSWAGLRTGIRGYDAERQRVFYSAVLERASADPDVASAALTSTIPPQEWGTRVSVFRPGDEPSPAELAGHEFELGLRTYVDEVSPSLFATMRIALVHGRGFTTQDDERSAPVVVVSRRLAEMLWPGEDPIGQYLSWPSLKGETSAPLQVVGVAADTRHASLTSDPPPMMYVPYAQRPSGSLALVLRGRRDGPVDASVFRRIVAPVDPTVPVFVGGTLEAHVAEEVQPQRTATAWVGVFGAIALLLAAIGLYGVVAQGVLQRTRELAVRVAIGATPGGIQRMVLDDGMRLVATGVTLGVLGAIAAVRVLGRYLAGVQPADLQGAVPAAIVLAAAMLAACWLPARRASRLDPATVLRAD